MRQSTRSLPLFATLLTLIIAGLVFAAYNKTQKVTRSHGSDFTIHHAFHRWTDQSGKVVGTVHANQVNYQNNTGLLTLNAPRITIKDRRHSTWRMRAQQGTSTPHHSTITLKGNVVLSETNQGLVTSTLKAQSLVIMPDQHLAISEQPVEIHRANSIVRAQGIRINLNTGKMLFL